MKRKCFLKYGGMDNQRYTGEDSEFFERMKKKHPNLRVFYSSNLFIYYKERRMFGFFLQRLTFVLESLVYQMKVSLSVFKSLALGKYKN